MSFHLLVRSSLKNVILGIQERFGSRPSMARNPTLEQAFGHPILSTYLACELHERIGAALASAKALAVARPMPEPAPVTSATLFSKEKFIIELHHSNIEYRHLPFSRDHAEPVVFLRKSVLSAPSRRQLLGSP
jgi:hypothetical protein